MINRAKGKVLYRRIAQSQSHILVEDTGIEILATASDSSRTWMAMEVGVIRLIPVSVYVAMKEQCEGLFLW